MPTIGYTIEDATGAVAASTLDIDVIPSDDPTSNDPPVANDDTNSAEQGGTVTSNVIDGNDSDPDTPQDDLVVTEFTYLDDMGVVQTGTLGGAAVDIYDEDGNLAGTFTMDDTGEYTFVADMDYTGEVPVDYTIEDPEGGSSSATLTIDVVDDADNNTFANDDASIGEQGEPQMVLSLIHI